MRRIESPRASFLLSAIVCVPAPAVWPRRISQNWRGFFRHFIDTSAANRVKSPQFPFACKTVQGKVAMQGEIHRVTRDSYRRGTTTMSLGQSKLAAALAILLGAAAFAQSNQGTITGTI